MGFRGHDATIRALRERNSNERITSCELTQLNANDGTWFELPIPPTWITFFETSS